MSLIWDESEQGTEAWMLKRAGRITGSRAKDARDRLADIQAKAAKVDKKTGEILEPARPFQRGPYSAKARLYAMDLARQREGGKVLNQVFQNAAMRMGTEQEEHARRAYMLRSGYLVQTCGFAYTDDGKFGVSPDGLPDGDPDGEDGILEIKTMVSSENLFTAFIDGDISEFRDQCLMEMWLLHKKWCDLALWAPDMPVPLRVIRIERDEDEIQRLVDDLVEFDRLVETYRAKLRERMAAMAEDPIAGWDTDALPDDMLEAAAEAGQAIEAAKAAPPAAPAPAPVTLKPGAVPEDIF